MEFQNEDVKLEAPVVYYKNQCTTIGRHKLGLQYLRRALAVLLSAYLFSVLLCFFSELPFLHSYTYYLSTFLLPLFTQILERKCMFLLCNGILVFLAGKSGLCSASGRHQEAESDDMREKIINADQEMILQKLAVVEPVCEVETRTLDDDVASLTYTIPQVMLKSAQLDGEAAAEYQAGMADRSDQAEDQACEDDVENGIENGDCGFLVGGGTDTDTEGHSSNSEELNKKIEEFIRKMKEELRLEAQRQPVIAA